MASSSGMAAVVVVVVVVVVIGVVVQKGGGAVSGWTWSSSKLALVLAKNWVSFELKGVFYKSFKLHLQRIILKSFKIDILFESGIDGSSDESIDRSIDS